MRLKGQHIINEMYLFSVVAKSLLKLLPHKIQNRVTFSKCKYIFDCFLSLDKQIGFEFLAAFPLNQYGISAQIH